METSNPPPRRRLAAVWFADIVGFSTLSHVDEDAALRLVGILQTLATRATERYEGRVVKFIGDSALSEFTSTEAAVRSAVELMESYHVEARALGTDSTIRIGVHLGEVAAAGEDIYGDGVNTAARLQGTAGPGQILVSEDVWRQLRMRPEFRFESKGEVELRGITARIGVFHVLFGARAALEAAVADAAATRPAGGDKTSDPGAELLAGPPTRARRRRSRSWYRYAGALVFVLAIGGGVSFWTWRPAAPADPGEAAEAVPTPPAAAALPAAPPLEPDAADAVSPMARPSVLPDPHPPREEIPSPPAALVGVAEPAAPAEPAERAADPSTDRELAIAQCIAALDAFVLLVAGHTGADFSAPFVLGDRERAQLAAVYLRADGPVEASVLTPRVRRLTATGAEVDFVLLITFREVGIPGSVPLPFRASLHREPAAWQLASVTTRG